MDIRLKKTALAVVLGLGLAGVANAAGFTAPACAANPVSIPCEGEAWDVAIEGLYWKPIVYDKTTYLFDFNGDADDDFVLRHVDSDFEWGFRVEGSYHFGTGNDLTINWTHLRGSNTEHTDFSDFDDANFFDGLSFSEVVWPVDVDVWGTVRTRFDSVNAEFGQHFDVGNNLDLRVHVGLQYAKISIEQNEGVLVTEQGDYYDFFYALDRDSDFRGIGPRVGMDWNYHLGNGVDFVARFAGEVLVGKTDTDSAFSFGDADDASNSWTITADGGSRDAIVPGAEGRLGLSYTHDMDGDGMLTLEGGWHAAAYTNAVMHFPSQALTAAPIVFNELHDTSSYGQHGPYLQLKYVSNKV